MEYVHHSQPPLLHSWVLRVAERILGCWPSLPTPHRAGHYGQLTGTSPSPTRDCRGMHHGVVDDGYLSLTVTGDRFRYSLWPEIP